MAGTHRDFNHLKRTAVRDFYALNHANQTVASVESKRREYLPLRRRRMGAWDALRTLGELVDDSDPDFELWQIDDALQTAEALRADDRPRWLLVAELLPDELQW